MHNSSSCASQLCHYLPAFCLAITILPCTIVAHRRSTESRKNFRIALGGQKEKIANVCTIRGPDELEVNFPVKSCSRECMTGVVDGGIQIHKQFPLIFTTELKNGKCMCNVDGKKTVQLPARRPEDREFCKTAAAAEGQKACWKQYLKGLATNFELLGTESHPLVVPRKRHILDNDFSAYPSSCRQSQCVVEDDTSCRSSYFPRLVDHLEKDVKTLLFKVVHGETQVSSLQEFASHLVLSDHAELAFTVADENGNERLNSDQVIAILQRAFITPGEDDNVKEFVEHSMIELNCSKLGIDFEEFEIMYTNFTDMGMPIDGEMESPLVEFSDEDDEDDDVETTSTTTTSTTTTTTTTTTSTTSHILHAITVEGFLEDYDGWERGYLSGTYFEALGDHIYGREVYFNEETSSALYYCGHEKVWCLVDEEYLEGARKGKCPTFAKTAPGSEILDRSLVAFTRIWTDKWENLQGVSVVAIDIIDPSEAV